MVEMNMKWNTELSWPNPHLSINIKQIFLLRNILMNLKLRLIKCYIFFSFICGLDIYMDTQQVTGSKDQLLWNVDIQKTGKNQMDRNDIKQICWRKTENNTPAASRYQSPQADILWVYRNLTYEILTGRMDGSRGRYRPRRTWNDNIKE